MLLTCFNNNIDDFIKFTNKAEEIDEIINYANFEIKSHFSDEELKKIDDIVNS